MKKELREQKTVVIIMEKIKNQLGFLVCHKTRNHTRFESQPLPGTPPFIINKAE